MSNVRYGFVSEKDAEKIPWLTYFVTISTFLHDMIWIQAFRSFKCMTTVIIHAYNVILRLYFVAFVLSNKQNLVIDSIVCASKDSSGLPCYTYYYAYFVTLIHETLIDSLVYNK